MPADAKCLGAIEELTTGDVAVLVLVKQIQQLLRVLGCLPSLHVGLLVVRLRPATTRIARLSGCSQGGVLA